jgi:hypothetical protein
LKNIINHKNMLLRVCECGFRYLSAFYLITFTLVKFVYAFDFYSQKNLLIFGTRLGLD